ncbi:MAG: hypothetical protein KAQ81_10650 [Deltaproteobacteria bacterium]|nr:hypothetical protein [Deltaproteobacteria bacterium]
MHSLYTLWCCLLISTFFFFSSSPIVFAIDPLQVEPASEELLTGKPFIYRIKSDKRGGEAFKLVYLVKVPIEVLWAFKSDFECDFLLTNKFVKEHRFISREDNVVITEIEYSNAPNDKFRWRTTLNPSDYRLDFVLENPKECGQLFHYGRIQLKAIGKYTKVTHVAYFDFFGVSLWVNYTWQGGMAEFLDYTARWEQKAVLRLKDRYKGKITK